MNNSNIMDNKNIKLPEIVSVPVPLYKSLQGKYFVGQTEPLLVGNGYNAWAGLLNPPHSNVDLFTNVFTISNYSKENLIAEIWLNTNNPAKWNISDKVSPTNTSLDPLPKNNINIGFVSYTSEVPISGVNVYERIVPPYTTLVGEEDGKFIEAPAGNYVLIIKSVSSELIKVVVAFGWFEKLRCH